MPAQPNCQARGRDKSTTLIRNQLQNDYSPLISSVPRSSKGGKPWKKCSEEQKEKFVNSEIDTKLIDKAKLLEDDDQMDMTCKILRPVSADN